MPFILQKYLVKKYLFYLVVILLVISSVLFVFDFIELTRVTISKNVSLLTLITLAAQKNPMHIQKVFGFIILIAAMLTYMQLSKNSELIIFKAAGLSTYQFVAPLVVTAVIIGIIHLSIINPLTTVLTVRYLKNESIYLKGNPNTLALSKTGLWIKQVSNQRHDASQNLIHAMRIEPNKKLLHEVTFYFFDRDKGFIERIDADSAEFAQGHWLLKNSRHTQEGQVNKVVDNIKIPTQLTFLQIQKSLVLPEGLSVWKLPDFINLAESSGLPTSKYKLYFYRLLVIPLFFAAMTLLGASFSMNIERFNKGNIMMVLVLMIGFFIYFFSDLIFAFGVAGSIPIWLATIAPSMITMFIGISIITYLEETRS